MTATCHRWEHQAYCDAVESEIARFVDVAREADPAARVPTCPDWDAAALFDHIGTVHRWAERHVDVLPSERIPSATMNITPPEDPAGFPDWIAEGGARLVSTLRRSDPAAGVWGWGSDHSVLFWSRRQLHETAVHRADAEFALGRSPVIDAAIGVDGVDEFLDNLPFAVYFAPSVKDLRGNGEQIALRSNEAAWLITLGPDGFTWTHGEVNAGVTVKADAGDLLLFTYGRRKPDDTAHLTIEGDRALLDRWIENSSI
jgi:uncharacterized protein (TIGR03083 family)